MKYYRNGNHEAWELLSLVGSIPPEAAPHVQRLLDYVSLLLEMNHYKYMERVARSKRTEKSSLECRESALHVYQKVQQGMDEEDAISEVSIEYDILRGTVAVYWKKFQDEEEQRRRKKRDQKIRQLYDNGMSNKEIAAETNVSTSTVKRALKAAQG